MRRRGFNDDLPDALVERPLPPRLGGPAVTRRVVGRSSTLASPIQRRYRRPITPLSQSPQLQIFEDDIDDQIQDAVLVAQQDDIQPTVSVLQPSLSVNIMGVNYGEDPDMEDIGDDENHGTIGNPEPPNKQDAEEVEETVMAEQDGLELGTATGHESATLDTCAGAGVGDSVGQAPQGSLPTPEQLETFKEPAVEHIADGLSSPSGKLVDEFHLAMMLFVTASDLSTSQYQALTEVLALATPTGIASLPRSIKTLKENCRKTFPLSQIKARPVQISSDATPPKTETPKLAYYFDTSEYSRLWLNDPKLVLHLGLGMIVDNPTELWHGDAWLESVRTTSGDFARVGNEVILPSDCITFRDCTGSIAYGRVKGVGIDRRSSVMSAPAALESKIYSVIVNRLLPASQLPDHVKYLRADVPGGSTYPSHPSNLPELILFESRDIIPCSEILSKEWVYFTDYESVDMLSESLLPQAPKFCVRRIVYQSSTGVLCSRPVHQRHRITAESELITLTRAYVLSNLVNGGIPTLGPNSLSPHTRRVSLPYSVFLDGFGLYRNAYHSLKGMYITPAGLDVNSRTQLGNMFVLMIGPFGSSEKGMAECLAQDSNKVGQGFRLKLHDSGEEIIATTFPIMFVGDMPQQNQNSGNKTHNAQFGCRYCFVPDIQRGNLQFDFVASGRYQCPVKRLYNGAMSLSSKTARLETLQKYGLTADGPYFAQCYPMLDPQRTNPNDPMHAELRLSKYFAETLVDGILSPTGILAYRAAWEGVEVPYGWGQPQNPVNHKGSMVFSEHGEMAVMNPFILLHLFANMESEHSEESKTSIKKSFIKANVEGKMAQAFGSANAARTHILRTAFLMAKTVSLAMKRTLSLTERKEFHATLIEGRLVMRKLFLSTGGGRGSYQKYADVPNVHLGLHYAQDIENYATTFNSSTMLGEQKHKIFKQHAAHTNSKDSDFQLLKAINTTQTIRFLLDGAYNISAPDISKQVRNVVDRCPILKVKFLGRASTESEQPLLNTSIRSGKVDTDGTLLKSAKTGRPITLKTVSAANQHLDLELLSAYYKDVLDTALVKNMRYKIHYWGYLSGKTQQRSVYEGYHHFFKLSTPRAFVRLRDDTLLTFYCVHRIMTLTIGTSVSIFLILEALQRDAALEVAAAPYPVYKETAQFIIAELKRVDPTILHFVNRGPKTWWWNPFVPHFM